MAIKSKFQRLMKIEKGLPKTGINFLKESNVFINTHTLIAGWFKGDIGKTNSYVLVLQNMEDETYLVISRKDGNIVTEKCDTLYQTFLAHKAARFAK
jgi:hypothetical protein